jgi:holliday junction DNA helicase RuvA
MRLDGDNFNRTDLMIAHIRGRLLSKHPNQAIVDCGGVGYQLAITVPTFSAMPEAGSEVALFVHTHVREDQIALFGFLKTDEKALFEKLIAVSGIGPKLAITVLSGMAAPDMVAAIRGNDLTRLTKIPGVGKKTAERMVLELKDKLDQFTVTEATTIASKTTPLEEDILSALVNLGYQRAIAERALQSLGPANGRGFEQLFRAAMAAIK